MEKGAWSWVFFGEKGVVERKGRVLDVGYWVCTWCPDREERLPNLLNHSHPFVRWKIGHSFLSENIKNTKNISNPKTPKKGKRKSLEFRGYRPRQTVSPKTVCPGWYPLGRDGLGLVFDLHPPFFTVTHSDLRHVRKLIHHGKVTLYFPLSLRKHTKTQKSGGGDGYGMASWRRIRNFGIWRSCSPGACVSPWNLVFCLSFGWVGIHFGVLEFCLVFKVWDCLEELHFLYTLVLGHFCF